jgi:predicted AAA+ superfamily ATPase
MLFEIPIEKYNEANTYKKRDCFAQLEEYINGGSTKVCILYGLRGTGKSTMMFFYYFVNQPC